MAKILRDIIKTSRIKGIISFLFKNAVDPAKAKTLFNTKDLHNGFIKCQWKISSIDHKLMRKRKAYYFGIRVFDTGAYSPTNTSSCIMKEVEISKKLCFYYLPMPIKSGHFLIQLGYRAKDSTWITLLSSKVNLSFTFSGKHISLEDLDWFSTNSRAEFYPPTLHSLLIQ